MLACAQNDCRVVLFKAPFKALVCVAILVSSLKPAIAQDAGALQRQLQQEVERSKPALPLPAEKPVEKKQSNPNEQTLEVRDFQFKGNTLFTQEELEGVVKSWRNRPITFSDLQNLIVSIQEFYAAHNRIAQANIPPQEVKDGILVIQILEGKMGSVIVEPKNGFASTRFSIANAKLYFAHAANGNQYIDTKPISRAMVLLNELPGVQAQGSFESGERPGESNFRVQIADGPLFTGQGALSNYGSPSTGAGQALANLSLNNPSGPGDQATVDAIQSLGSTYGQLGYSLPVARDGWRIGLQGNFLSYKTLSSWSSTQTQGTASTIGANTSYALLRDQNSNVNLRFAIEDRNYSNNQSGLNISQYQITALTAGIQGNFSDSDQSIINYSATITSGNLNINNLTQAGQDLSGPGTAGAYQKLGFNFSRNQELIFLPRTSWLFSVYGQLANKNLNSSEQIYMGGPYAVRAYPVSQGGGSQGIILSTELQHRLDESWQVGVFADLGLVQQYINLYPSWQGLTNANNNYQLGAIGPTLKYTYEGWLVNAMAAFRIGQNPLYNSSGQQLNTDNAYRAVQGWVKASYYF